MKSEIKSAFKTSIPVLFGYMAIGIAFGLVLVDAGYDWWFAPLMSIIVYAGAAQFIAIGLFAAGTPLFAIIITELLVNIRHIVYGLSLITRFQNCGKWKPYLVFALTDETYSLLTCTDVPEGQKPADFYGFVSLFDQSYWVLGSTIGALFGALIPFDMTGVDFALTALFAVLTVEQIMKTKDLVPTLAGAISVIIAILLWRFGYLGDSSNILFVALALGIGTILLMKKNNLKEDSNGSTGNTI